MIRQRADVKCQNMIEVNSAITNDQIRDIHLFTWAADH